MCSVVGVQQDYVRLSLEDVLYPDGITSNNVEYEKLKKQTKWVTEHYNAYKGNYSGNIDFDKEDGSKNSYLYKQRKNISLKLSLQLPQLSLHPYKLSLSSLTLRPTMR